MKLYSTLRSPYARKVRVMALEKNIDLNIVNVDLVKKPEELLRLNPVGKIPVLECDDGLVLSDSTLICDYLDDIRPDPAMLPRDKNQRWTLRHLDMLAKGLTDATVALFMEQLVHPDNAHPKYIARQKETIIRTLGYFNKQLNALDSLNAASIGLACAIGYIQFRAEDLWPQTACTNLTAWYDTFCQRDSLRQTIPQD